MRRLAFKLAIASFAAIAPLWAHADDQQIAQAIANKLKQERAAGKLRGFDIDLQVKGGEVALKGFVADSRQQTLAEEVATSIDGVISVVNELEVRDSKKTQESKPERSKPAALKADAFDDADSDVTETEPTRIDTAVEPISNREDFDSDDESAEVANRVIDEIQRLKKSGKFKGFGIDLEVDGGVVTLNGKVSSVEQRNMVIDRVRRIDGVEKVIDALTISGVNSKVQRAAIPAELPTETRSAKSAPRASAPDANEVVREIVRRLESKRDQGALRGFDVDVRYNDGSVTLSGSVPSADQQTTVLEVVRRVPGVKRVVNNLSIAGLQRPVQYTSEPTYVGPGQVEGDGQVPLAYAPAQIAGHNGLVANHAGMGGAAPVAMHSTGYGVGHTRYDHPQLPAYAWPSYAAYPNYAGVTYPRQYSATAWPYIGPFYPYPQVPLGWRKVSLEWDDGFWHLDFKDRHSH